MTLIHTYLQLTKEYKEKYGERTIVLYQVGAFFEVYGINNKETNIISGSQIVEFSKICDLNIADKKTCVDENNVLMAGFSHYMIDKYIKKLQESGYTSVVYTQDENMKNTSRSLNCIYSPGTFFSQDSIHITNNTTCIWLNVVDTLSSSTTFKKVIKTNSYKKLIHVGISNIDILTGKTNIFEFKEIYINNPTTFDNLERFISIYNPSEIIIISQNITNDDIDNIIQYSGIQTLSIHRINLSTDEKSSNAKYALNCEKQIYQTEILNKFYREKMADFQHFYEYTFATQSFCFLLDFIYQHNPNLVNKISEPIFDNCSDRLILANHSLKQLNIIDDNYNGKFSSVSKLLNLCITSMGQRHFSHILVNPTTNINYLREEYDMISFLLNNIPDIILLRNNLQNIKDISKINRQIIMKKITPKLLVSLYHNLIKIKNIHSSINKELNNYLTKKNINDSEYITRFCDEIIDFLENNIDITLSENIDTYNNFDNNFIKKNVDENLDNQYKCLLDSTDKLEAIRLFFNTKISKHEKKDKTNDFIKIHETEKSSIHLISTKRRCVILKKELFNQNQNSWELSYLSSYSGKEETFQFIYDREEISFVNQSGNNDFIILPQIQELCKNITIIKNNLKDIISSVYLNNIIHKISNLFINKLETIILFVTYIDVIYTKAFIANKYKYCKPEIDDKATKSYFSAKGLRHALIEHLQINEIYVTNDIELGSENKDGILLYGTNAVGKTSFIRAIGISIIMAQSGLYVPCSSFIYKPYEYIFTRILGNDNIFKGLSTFAVEMSELRTILNMSNENSLILGDELCSGTESISAKSIFVSGINKIVEKKSSFIFATHLHEIIDYDEISDCCFLSLKHMSVSYNREKDKLIYDRKIKDGPGNNMYGLEVCRSLNLPNDFLELADKIRMKYNDSSNSLLSLKQSKYNNKKLRTVCEKCGENMSTEIHHLIPQKLADENGYIKKEDGTVFHKNHLANLMAVCESCHKNIHKI